MSDDGFASVWDAIENTTIDAENMKLRSQLMMALEDHIASQNWTEAEAARRLGVTQPRIVELLGGRISQFGLDGLIAMAVAAGLQVELRVAKAA